MSSRNPGKMDEKTKQLLELIKKIGWKESRLLYEHPAWQVPLEPLLDGLAEIYGLDKDEIADLVND